MVSIGIGLLLAETNVVITSFPVSGKKEPDSLIPISPVNISLLLKLFP